MAEGGYADNLSTKETETLILEHDPMDNLDEEELESDDSSLKEFPPLQEVSVRPKTTICKNNAKKFSEKKISDKKILCSVQPEQKKINQDSSDSTSSSSSSDSDSCTSYAEIKKIQ